MSEEVAEYVKRCSVCQRVDDKPLRPKAELHPIPVPREVWKQVIVVFIIKDYFVIVISGWDRPSWPLPVSSSGNKYIVTAIDYFSRWPEAAALPDKTAKGVAAFIYSTCCR